MLISFQAIINSYSQPFTGDIVAITSFPDFNPNSYFEYDMENFKNRAISDSYEPGSTFKIIPIAIALESEKYSMQHEIYCENGKFLLSNKRFLRDHESYGNLSIMDINFEYLDNSCDFF